MPVKITFNEFKKRVIEKFGNDIDLSLIDEETFNYQSIYPFKCLKHNKIVYRHPKLLLKHKTICEDCLFELRSSISLKPHKYNGKYNMYTFNEIKDIIHSKNNLYSIVDLSFNDNDRVFRKTKIKCNCEKHGEFETTVGQIIDSKWCGCEQCRREHTSNELIKQGEIRRQTFINNAVKVHGQQYDYSLVDLTGKLSKVKIICPKHGIFKMYPSNHTTRGQGCPMCNQDKLNCERRLGELLRLHLPNINIIQQYHGFLGRQSLDYFIPDYNIGIEYQGSQHFEKNTWFIDERHNINKRFSLDELKYNKCTENNVTLLYFTFSKEYGDLPYFSKIYTNIFELIEKINELIK